MIADFREALKRSSDVLMEVQKRNYEDLMEWAKSIEERLYAEISVERNVVTTETSSVHELSRAEDEEQITDEVTETSVLSAPSCHQKSQQKKKISMRW